MACEDNVDEGVPRVRIEPVHRYDPLTGVPKVAGATGGPCRVLALT